MTLSEFVKSRRDELGLSWRDIEDAGILMGTYHKIASGKQLTMKPATMEKLALVLKCSIGDLQAAMADTPHPLRKEAEQPEGTAGHNMEARPKRKKKEPEPAEVFQPEAEEEVDTMFPVEEVEQPKETLAEFKARLTQILLEEMLVTESSLTSLVLQNFGKRVIEELKVNAE